MIIKSRLQAITVLFHLPALFPADESRPDGDGYKLDKHIIVLNNSSKTIFHLYGQISFTKPPRFCFGERQKSRLWINSMGKVGILMRRVLTLLMLLKKGARLLEKPADKVDILTWTLNLMFHKSFRRLNAMGTRDISLTCILQDFRSFLLRISLPSSWEIKVLNGVSKEIDCTSRLGRPEHHLIAFAAPDHKSHPRFIKKT